MIITSVLSTIILLSSSILLAPNPITAALSLLAIAIITATIFAVNISTWIAIIVFLVYVAGILVIFAYFVAITPNQQIMISANPILFPIIFFIAISYILSISNLTIPNTSINIIFLYTNNNPVTLLFLALALLLTIVVVVKISGQSKGPLRSFI